MNSLVILESPSWPGFEPILQQNISGVGKVPSPLPAEIGVSFQVFKCRRKRFALSLPQD
jgi:hypothetical protein